MAKKVKITMAIAKKVLATVDAGLVEGKGVPIPGQMCVEAAVAYAMGESHNDRPKCVTSEIIDTKIIINDHNIWATIRNADKIRAKVLRRLAIAQLGSKGVISGKQWDNAVNDYASNLVKDTRDDRITYLKILEETSTKLKSGERVFLEYINWDPVNFQDYLPDHVKDLKHLSKICEDLVQILINLKSPGTKFLYLTEKPKQIAKKKPKKK